MPCGGGIAQTFSGRRQAQTRKFGCRGPGGAAKLYLMTVRPIKLAALLATILVGAATALATDPLASWNDGPAKQAILNFVQATTAPGSPQFVPPAERIATFDQDGTLWVEQPVYAQVLYAIDQVPALVEKNPDLKNQEPFQTILAGNKEAVARLPAEDFIKLFEATTTGMTVEEYSASVRSWLAKARDARWNRPFTDLTYQPMRELLEFLRASGFKTYIVTGSGQDFVRVYSEAAYGIPPEQVMGTADATRFGYDKEGKPSLTKMPKVLLNDVFGGKPEGIHLMIGRRPCAAVGNSTGDQQMLEYTKAGGGARLAMLVLHDDPEREYAYGPAQGLPDSRIGTFTQELHDEAAKSGWTVISMKNDWKRIFGFGE